MLHNKKPVKANQKKSSRRMKPDVIRSECSDECKYYPNQCLDCPYERNESHEEN